jgi:two-component system, NtrC family, response regulator AtoC
MKGASILIVDDDAAFRNALRHELQRLEFTVTKAATGTEALARLESLAPDVVLLDLRLPDMSGLDVLKAIRERHAAADVIVLTGHGSIDTAIESIRMGAFDYVAKPCPIGELEIRIERALERQSLRKRASLLERGLTPPDLGGSFIGESEPFRALINMIDRVGASTSAVLITGETGSGKEMVAKLLHARSPRRRHPFVVVDCGTLQESLLQSELFGHDRGAFTGADRTKPGLFEVANGGTIFLDEIGEISLATQVRLLRVLDTSTFRHVGGTSEIHVNVRLIAATNRNLEAMLRQQLFRQDLYYRMSSITLRVPPLRERPTDIDLLADYFLARLNERFGGDTRLSPAARALLARHDWPGNVREMQHAIEGAVVVCEGGEIQPEHLPAAVRAPSSAIDRTVEPAGSAEPPAVSSLEMLERSQIELALKATTGHRGQAAKLLGISERSLYRKLKEYELA